MSKFVCPDGQVINITHEMAMVSQYGTMSRDFKNGMRQGVDKSVKAYIYDNKDVIIEKCVSRATAELVRKGIPKLIERMEQEE